MYMCILTLTRKAETESGSVMWEQCGWWLVMELRGNRMLHVGHLAGLQGTRPASVRRKTRGGGEGGGGRWAR